MTRPILGASSAKLQVFFYSCQTISYYVIASNLAELGKQVSLLHGFSSCRD